MWLSNRARHPTPNQMRPGRTTGVFSIDRAVRSDSEEAIHGECERECDQPENPVTESEAGGCCGGPAPEGASACCARDADVKAAGGDGCGCGSTLAAAPKPAASGCCSR